VLAGELEEGAVGADAGVRDHDVEPAEALDGRGDGGVHRLGVAYIARDTEPRLEAEVVTAAGREPDRGTGVVQRTGDRGSDPAAPPR
jgi:hypothetical protein